MYFYDFLIALRHNRFNNGYNLCKSKYAHETRIRISKQDDVILKIFVYFYIYFIFRVGKPIFLNSFFVRLKTVFERIVYENNKSAEQKKPGGKLGAKLLWLVANEKINLPVRAVFLLLLSTCANSSVKLNSEGILMIIKCDKWLFVFSWRLLLKFWCMLRNFVWFCVLLSCIICLV